MGIKDVGRSLFDIIDGPLRVWVVESTFFGDNTGEAAKSYSKCTYTF